MAVQTQQPPILGEWRERRNDEDLEAAEGMPESLAGATLPKFRPGGLLVAHAGGRAGMFSAIIAGWPASGDLGSAPVTVEVRE